MFKFIQLKKIFFFVFTFSFFLPIVGWSYTNNGVETDGTPLRQFTNRPLVWNVEQGALQDTRQILPVNIDPNVTLRQIQDFCRANPALFLPPSGGGGSGGCSLNPFIREAKADSITSNQDGVNLIIEAWNRWKTQAAAAPYSADTSFITLTPGTPLTEDGGDVNLCNVDQFIDTPNSPFTGVTDPRICGCFPTPPAGCNTPCRNPIIFDTNGEITTYLGFNKYSTLALTEEISSLGRNPNNGIGFNIIINTTCLDNSPDPNCGPRYDTNDLRAIITHEVGHALGLGHSQVNDATNPARPPDYTKLPTMFPGIVTSEQSASMLNLKRDDLMGFTRLYRDSNNLKANSCTIQGSVFEKGNGGNPLRCVEVVARIANPPAGIDPLLEAVEFVSGAEAPSTGGVLNNCTNQAQCGHFNIQIIPPQGIVNPTYNIEVHKLNASGSGSSIGPCGPAVNTSPPNINPNTVTFSGGLGKTITCTPGRTLTCGTDFGCPNVDCVNSNGVVVPCPTNL